MRQMFCLSLVVLFSACGSDETRPNPGSSGNVTTGKMLTITGTISHGPCMQAPELPDPTWSYQTPSGAKIGVADVELLSATDPSAHAIMSESPALEADLVRGATFAQVDTGSIPEDVYLSMRVKLDWVLLTVDATAHAAGYTLPGLLDVNYAVSDHNSPEAGPRLQGDYLATFNAGLADISQSGSDVLDYPPPYPEATVDVSNGEYWVTFQVPGGPIVVTHDRPEQVDVDVDFCIEDAFAWSDTGEPEFVDGVFDLSADAASEKPTSVMVRNFTMNVRQ